MRNVLRFLMKKRVCSFDMHINFDHLQVLSIRIWRNLPSAGTFNQNLRVFTFCRYFTFRSDGNNSIYSRRKFFLLTMPLGCSQITTVQYHDQNLDKQLLNAPKYSKIASERKLGTKVFSKHYAIDFWRNSNILDIDYKMIWIFFSLTMSLIISYPPSFFFRKSG